MVGPRRTAIEKSDKTNFAASPSPREERAGRGSGRGEFKQGRPPLPGPLLLRSSGGEGEPPASLALSFLKSTAVGGDRLKAGQLFGSVPGHGPDARLQNGLFCRVFSGSRQITPRAKAIIAEWQSLPDFFFDALRGG